MKSQKLHYLIIPSLLGSSVVRATITVNSHQFSAVTNGAVDTTGTLDWGFVSVLGGLFDSDLDGNGESHLNTDFALLDKNDGTVITTVNPDSAIGTVTLTEGTAGNNTVDGQNNVPNYTFDGVMAQGAYGNFAPTEQDVWQLTFNDLGIGDFEIKLYMGHSNPGRGFDMDVTGTGITTLTTTLSPLSSLESTVAAYGTTGASFTYDINITTTDASDDLTLTFGGTGGGFGGAILAGYTVTGSTSGPQSALKITGITYAAGIPSVDLTWNSAEGQTYVVKYSTDLVDWTGELGSPSLADTGTETSRSFNLSEEGLDSEATLFFRVEELALP